MLTGHCYKPINSHKDSRKESHHSASACSDGGWGRFEHCGVQLLFKPPELFPPRCLSVFPQLYPTLTNLPQISNLSNPSNSQTMTQDVRKLIVEEMLEKEEGYIAVLKCLVSVCICFSIP